MGNPIEPSSTQLCLAQMSSSNWTHEDPTISVPLDLVDSPHASVASLCRSEAGSSSPDVQGHSASRLQSSPVSFKSADEHTAAGPNGALPPSRGRYSPPTPQATTIATLREQYNRRFTPDGLRVTDSNDENLSHYHTSAVAIEEEQEAGRWESPVPPQSADGPHAVTSKPRNRWSVETIASSLRAEPVPKIDHEQQFQAFPPNPHKKFPWKESFEERYPPFTKEPNLQTEFERRYPPDRFGEEASDNARLWKIYRDRAKEIDEDLFQGWNKTLDSLLIFAGLFSAVATSFIIEIGNQLQPDYSEYLVKIQLALHRNSSTVLDGSDLDPETFSPKPSTRATNGLWVFSLTFALVVALLSILAKQWLVEYDSRMRSQAASSRRWTWRHLVFNAGLTKWKLDAFIMSLPLLLHTSLFLFLIGLANYFIETDIGSSILVLIATGITLAFYIAATLLPLWYPECPWRTPLLFQGREGLIFLGTWLRRKLRLPVAQNGSAKPAVYDEEQLFRNSQEQLDTKAVLWMIQTLPIVEEVDAAVDGLGSIEFSDDAMTMFVTRDELWEATERRLATLRAAGDNVDHSAVGRFIRVALALEGWERPRKFYEEVSSRFFIEDDLLEHWRKIIPTFDVYFTTMAIQYRIDSNNQSLSTAVAAWFGPTSPATPSEQPCLASTVTLAMNAQKRPNSRPLRRFDERPKFHDFATTRFLLPFVFCEVAQLATSSRLDQFASTVYENIQRLLSREVNDLVVRSPGQFAQNRGELISQWVIALNSVVKEYHKLAVSLELPVADVGSAYARAIFTILSSAPHLPDSRSSNDRYRGLAETDVEAYLSCVKAAVWLERPWPAESLLGAHRILVAQWEAGWRSTPPESQRRERLAVSLWSVTQLSGFADAPFHALVDWLFGDIRKLTRFLDTELAKNLSGPRPTRCGIAALALLMTQRGARHPSVHIDGTPIQLPFIGFDQRKHAWRKAWSLCRHSPTHRKVLLELAADTSVSLILELIQRPSGSSKDQDSSILFGDGLLFDMIQHSEGTSAEVVKRIIAHASALCPQNVVEAIEQASDRPDDVLSMLRGLDRSTLPSCPDCASVSQMGNHDTDHLQGVSDVSSALEDLFYRDREAREPWPVMVEVLASG